MHMLSWRPQLSYLFINCKYLDSYEYFSFSPVFYFLFSLTILREFMVEVLVLYTSINLEHVSHDLLKRLNSLRIGLKLVPRETSY